MKSIDPYVGCGASCCLICAYEMLRRYEKLSQPKLRKKKGTRRRSPADSEIE